MLFLIVVYASVAQQVERTAVNRDVGGSSPLRDVPTFQPIFVYSREVRSVKKYEAYKRT